MTEKVKTFISCGRLIVPDHKISAFEVGDPYPGHEKLIKITLSDDQERVFKERDTIDIVTDQELADVCDQ